MSGPVTTTDASPAVADCGHPSAPCVEVSDSRDERVGKIRVRRALPRKGRRMGDFGELVSPARHDTLLVGVELDMHDRTLVPLNHAWEYALVVLEGRIGLLLGQAGRPLRSGALQPPLIPAKAPFWQQNQGLR
ncbi:MAG: hypothetical protein L0H24_00815 [Microlunatus sp.]|nr:hypothetical protein [Microlunatus sp.]